MHHIEDASTHGWVPLSILPGGVVSLKSQALPGWHAFTLSGKGSNQQWPLNCDVLITSPGNLVKMQILWQEVWGRTWDSGFPDVNAAVQGPHFEQQSHISPSHTFFQLFTYSKCLVITMPLMPCTMLEVGSAAMNRQTKPSLPHVLKETKKSTWKWTKKSSYRQAGKHWRDSDRNRVLWASAMVLGLWSIKI